MLSADKIIAFGTRADSDHVIHATTITYIQAIMAPYLEVIAPVNDDQSIIDWIPLAMPGDLAKHARSEIDGAISDAMKEKDIAQLSQPEQALIRSQAAKDAFVKYLVTEILELANHHITNVLPWDVQTSIGDDEELSEMLKIPKGSQHMQVDVMIGGNSYSHMMTRDLASGLMLFSLISGADFGLSMFGTLYPKDFIVLERYTRIIPGVNSIMIGDVRYYFTGTDFMQGFNTGAQWTGINTKYWSELKNEVGQPMNF